MTCGFMLILLHDRKTHIIVQMYLPYKPNNFWQNNSYELSIIFSVPRIKNSIGTPGDTKYETYVPSGNLW